MEDLAFFERNLNRLPPALRERMRSHLRELSGADVEEARGRFLPFVRRVWPDYIHGRHHDVMSDAFERIEKGLLKRCIINMPPRSTKSRFTSILFPAWFLGKHPEKKIFEASHTASLAMDFGRDLRNLVRGEAYQEIFPGLGLAQDSRAAHRWSTKQGGEYFAVGKTGGAAGRGGDLVIIDDPHSEQDVLKSPELEFRKTWNWYLAGPRQRLQPGAAILVVMTRWGELDLTGRLIRQYAESDDDESEQWEVIELPAILPSGEPLFPEFWKLEELKATKATQPAARWAANYQQQPISEEGAIIKREWWKDWTKVDPPVCDFIVQAWDTAFSKSDEACRSACVSWGVFRYHTHGDPPQTFTGIILLDAWAGRIEFPELKRKAREFHDQWKPDSLVIEKKASGSPLIQELHRMGIYVSDLGAPSRSSDKVIRTHAVADLFSSGAVYAPLGRRWADQVVAEMNAFPRGEYDDLHDAAVWGLLRIRQGSLIHLGSDIEDDPDWKPRGPTKYY